jgi:hypothetical protein
MFRGYEKREVITNWPFFTRSLFKRYEKHEISEALTRLLDLKINLKQWWDNLPDTVMRKGHIPQQPVSRSEIHLKLEFCLVRMFASRPFMFPRDSTRSSSSSTGSTSGSHTDSVHPGSMPGKPNARSILVADCVDAALSVVETCQLLRNTIGLARASYTEFSSVSNSTSSICTFAHLFHFGFTFFCHRAI